MPRASVPEQIAAMICSRGLSHPVRVGIDGIDAAGKTTLADEVGGHVAKTGRHVIRASDDGFHRPRAERYRRGQHSPEGYYLDSFNYPQLRSSLLEPLGIGGSRRYRTARFDYMTDSIVEQEQQAASQDSILLFDGIFLFRPELDDCWDYRIWLEVDPEIALQRALARDTQLGAGIESRYRQRYMPAQRMYIGACHPSERADAVVLNNAVLNPELQVHSTPPLTG